MLPIAYFILISFLALLVESLVEAVLGDPFNLIKSQKWLTWKPFILRYVAMAVGVGLTFFYSLDLISLTWQMLGDYLKVPLPPIPSGPVGYVLTGLGIGRGASWLHDLVKKIIPNLPDRLPGA